MKFFSYDPEDGFQLHATGDEAKTRAQNAIDFYRDDSAEGWAEEVEGVCWGELRQSAMEIEIEPVNNHDTESCDYKLAAAECAAALLVINSVWRDKFLPDTVAQIDKGLATFAAMPK